jgi:hypothetical protein
MKDRFGARKPASWMLRFHTQTGGSTLTAQQPENNVVRVTVQAMADKTVPIRLAEYGSCYRYEKSGELFGLMRVRSMQMNDAHIYFAEDQFEQEFMAKYKTTLWTTIRQAEVQPLAAEIVRQSYLKLVRLKPTMRTRSSSFPQLSSHTPQGSWV